MSQQGDGVVSVLTLAACLNRGMEKLETSGETSMKFRQHSLEFFSEVAALALAEQTVGRLKSETWFCRLGVNPTAGLTSGLPGSGSCWTQSVAACRLPWQHSCRKPSKKSAERWLDTRGTAQVFGFLDSRQAPPPHNHQRPKQDLPDDSRTCLENLEETR